ncbi:MAG: ABC transporter permease [Proteobacteria bacterium]|nr:ABC transporter permease [Pseudomonadota bacterium]
MNARGARVSSVGALVPAPLRTIYARLGPQITSALSIAGGIALWELVGRLFVKNSLFLSTPSQIANEIAMLWISGELQMHMWVSGQEFFIGLTLAIVGGIFIGLVMTSSVKAEKILAPWVTALYATPTIAIAPLIILWFGIDIWSKVVICTLNGIFPMIINTDAGLRGAERHLIEAVRSFGATRWQIFWKVSLPSAIPYILAGVRLAVGRSIVAIVVGELFGARAGLGFMLIQASEVFNMSRLFAAVVILAVVGIALTSLAQALERHLVPWRRL